MSWSSKQIALEILNKIIDDTIEGKGPDGKPFSPLSTAYKRIKSDGYRKRGTERIKIGTYKRGKKKGDAKYGRLKKGAKVKGSGVDFANVFLTGQTLKNFQILDIHETMMFQKTDYGELPLPIPRVMITLGFSDPILEQRAESNIKRGSNFLGISKPNLDKIVKHYF
jgi:hypothetical protein